jgi:chromosome segregation ATPase
MQASVNIAAAQQVLGAAVAVGTKAQSKISDAQSTSSAAHEQNKQAKDSLEGGHAHLKEIEARIANQQQEGSEFNKALDDLEDARDNMTELREKITGSREYQKRYEQARAISAEKAADVKTELLDENSDYKFAISKYERAKVKFSNIFHKLLAEDKEWQDTVKDLREARASAGEAEGKMTGAGLSKMSARQDLKKAAAVAADAQAVIVANQAVLNSLPGNKNNNQNKPQQPSKAKK